MISIKQIRDELKQVRYYYANRQTFDRNMHITGNAKFIEIIKKYNEAIVEAEPLLYNIYASLYLENNTQMSLGEIWGYSQEHICYLNNKLVSYFYKRLNS